MKQLYLLFVLPIAPVFNSSRLLSRHPETLMRPFKTNPRVMDNLDNIYVYLKARSDGVFGPGNMIKFALGKK
jgi:hypothetical protein